MSQDDLAQRMGYDKSYISHIELNRAKRASYGLLVQLAAALEATVDELLRDTGLAESYRLGPEELSAVQERLIAFTRARLAHLTDAEGERLIRIIEAGFGERAPR
jgi:transcriptional regulator with XRE-family HTH domain